MSKNVKLAILRARHDPATPQITDQACIQMLMTSTTRRSVLNYWADNADGYLDFVDSEMFPWVQISLTTADLDANNQTPRITWRVGDVPITAYSNSINVPTSTGTFTIECTLDLVSDELTLTSRGGEKYTVDVVAQATEGGGNVTTATTSFDPLGYYNGFRPGDLAKLDHCMSRYARSARLSARDLLIPPGPDPYREQWKDRINLARVEEIARRIAHEYPAQSLGMSLIAAMRYSIVRGRTPDKSG